MSFVTSKEVHRSRRRRLLSNIRDLYTRTLRISLQFIRSLTQHEENSDSHVFREISIIPIDDGKIRGWPSSPKSINS